MNHTPGAVSMSQRIFAMDLPVEAVSLYLLCCALADAGTPITREALSDRWNGSDETLDREIASLEKRNVIGRNDADASAPASYRLMDDRTWR